jgi:hypothetical protein
MDVECEWGREIAATNDSAKQEKVGARERVIIGRQTSLRHQVQFDPVRIVRIVSCFEPST